jgi:transposase
MHPFYGRSESLQFNPLLRLPLGPFSPQRTVRLRRYRLIQVICDNARFHQVAKCKRLREYLERWGHRIKLHYLPCYAPETNPIERVWWHLHDEVTRNHSCRTLEELLDLVFRWLENRNPFAIEGSVYPPGQRHDSLPHLCGGI